MAAALNDQGGVVLASEGWLGELIHPDLAQESRAVAWQAVSSVVDRHCPTASVEYWLGEGEGGWLRLHAARAELRGQPVTFVCLLDASSTRSVAAADLGCSPVGYWLADSEWAVTYVCPRFARLLGYEQHAMIGRPATAFAAPAERDLGARQLQQRLSRPTDFLGARLQHCDGSLLDLVFASTPLLDGAGRVAGLASAAAELVTVEPAREAHSGSQRAIAAITSATRHLMEARCEADAAQGAIEALGQALQVDRAYLYQSASCSPTGATTLHYEWCAEGVPSQMNNLAWQRVAGPTAPADLERLLAAGHILAGNTIDLPEPVRSMLATNGIRSMAIAPVVVEGQLWGCVGVSDLHQERPWPAAEQSAVRAAGVIIGAALARYRLAEERDKTLARLELVLSRMPMTCVTTDLDWRCTYWNPAAESLFGWREEEMLGQSLLGRTTPLEVSDHLRGIAERLRNGAPIALSVNDNLTASGRRIICEWQNVPLHGPEGEVVGILCMAQDITDRRLAMDREREANARFDALVDASSQAIVAVDTEGRVTLWNPAAEALLGWSAADVLGRSLPYDSTDAEDLMRAFIAQVLAGQSLQRDTTHARRRDGRPLSLTISGTPLHDANGASTGALFVCTDRQERQRLVDELRGGEAECRAILDRLPVPICHIDPDLRVTYANQAGAAVLGQPLDQVIGSHGITNVPEDQLPTMMSEMSKLVNGADSVSAVLRHDHADGSSVFCEWTTHAHRDSEGLVDEFRSVGRLVAPPPSG
ncbi:MAG: PAS domain S-box protein [Armatimonadetes bacterium]|nr:PAS domain S-box protein [Armatimonadota bacterium]